MVTAKKKNAGIAHSHRQDPEFRETLSGTQAEGRDNLAEDRQR